MKNRTAVFKYSIIGKTTFTENISRLVKSIADFIRSMGICTDGDDLTAKLTVTSDNIDTWIRFTKPVVITACVQLDSHIFADQCPQDLVQDLLISSIRILTVLIWTITYYIVDMSVYIHLVKSSDIFQDGFKIFHIACGFLTALKIRRIIRIVSVHHMGGTNNEIKGNFFQKIGKRFCKLRLKSKLDPEVNLDLVFKSIRKTLKFLADAGMFREKSRFSGVSG